MDDNPFIPQGTGDSNDGGNDTTTIPDEDLPF
jgi:hypothetical protein|nr:MAG TPA: hypothetical protein [Caudoviricetes sp.]